MCDKTQESKANPLEEAAVAEELTDEELAATDGGVWKGTTGAYKRGTASGKSSTFSTFIKG